MGRTALLDAAVCGRDAIVRMLLKHGGSDLDIADGSRLTAMHYACHRGHAAILSQLLGAGADPRVRDVQGRTATEIATASGRHDCVRIMQEWDRAYLLQRLRRMRDASATSSSNTPQQDS